MLPTIKNATDCLRKKNFVSPTSCFHMPESCAGTSAVRRRYVGDRSVTRLNARRFYSSIGKVSACCPICETKRTKEQEQSGNKIRTK